MSVALFTNAHVMPIEPSSGSSPRSQKFRAFSNSVRRKYQTHANPVMP
jgi:hypothetical protein